MNKVLSTLAARASAFIDGMGRGFAALDVLSDVTESYVTNLGRALQSHQERLLAEVEQTNAS